VSCAELLRNLSRHWIGERRFRLIGNLAHASRAKQLDDFATGKVHADHLLTGLGPDRQSHASHAPVNQKTEEKLPGCWQPKPRFPR
jgi:hypothetical protein